MYEKEFAEVYNEDWAFFSERLARVLHAAVGERESVLDLGCGTGNFLKAFAGAKVRAGIDLSPYMIEIARKNCPGARLAVGNVLDFDFGRRFDLITCNFDMINHLPGLADYERLFVRVRRALAPGGVFAFDFNTTGEFSFVGRDIVDESGRYRKVFRDERVDDTHVRIEIEVFDKGRAIAGLTVVESLYDAAPVAAALERAGFTDVTFCDEDLLPARDLTVPRLYTLCRT